jgi:hypothetical protein
MRDLASRGLLGDWSLGNATLAAPVQMWIANGMARALLAYIRRPPELQTG